MILHYTHVSQINYLKEDISCFEIKKYNIKLLCKRIWTDNDVNY